MVGHRLGELQPAPDVLEQARDHLAEARVVDGVAQVGERLDDVHAGLEQLRQVEAEGDELGARDVARARRGRAFHALEGEEIEPEALQAQLEVDRVGGVEVAGGSAPVGVDGPVGEERH